MTLRQSLSAALVLPIVLACVAMPASAGSPQAFATTAAKGVDGAYTSQTKSLTIDDGETKIVFWRVRSFSGADQSMTFDDAATGGSDEGYKITWYKGKKQKTKISNQVKNAGYDYTLKADGTKFFNAKVKAKAGAGSMCLGGQSSNTPQTNSDGAYFAVNGQCD